MPGDQPDQSDQADLAVDVERAPGQALQSAQPPASGKPDGEAETAVTAQQCCAERESVTSATCKVVPSRQHTLTGNACYHLDGDTEGADRRRDIVQLASADGLEHHRQHVPDIVGRPLAEVDLPAPASPSSRAAILTPIP